MCLTDCSAVQLLSEIFNKIVVIDCRLDLKNLIVIKTLIDTEN